MPLLLAIDTKKAPRMSCYLLHVMEDPDRDAYRDPDLKDVVGLMPRFFCSKCEPLKPLLPSETLRCMDRTAPCWMAPDRTCDDNGPDAGVDKGLWSDG